jgi:hypothetical protein
MAWQYPCATFRQYVATPFRGIRSLDRYMNIIPQAFIYALAIKSIINFLSIQIKKAGKLQSFKLIIVCYNLYCVQCLGHLIFRVRERKCQEALIFPRKIK